MAGKVSRSSLPTDPDIIRGRLVAAGQLNKSFTPSAPENTDTSESLQTMLTSFLLWFWLQLLCSENIKLVDHLIIRSKIKFLHKSNKRPRISCAYMFWILIQPHYNTVRTSAEKARNCGIYRQRRVQIKSANIVVTLTRWQNSWMPTTAINKCNSKAAVHSNQKKSQCLNSTRITFKNMIDSYVQQLQFSYFGSTVIHLNMSPTITTQPTTTSYKKLALFL